MHDVLLPVVVPGEAGETGEVTVVPPPVCPPETTGTTPFPVEPPVVSALTPEFALFVRPLQTQSSCLNVFVVSQVKKAVWYLQHPSQVLVAHPPIVREADCATTGESKDWQLLGSMRATPAPPPAPNP